MDYEAAVLEACRRLSVGDARGAVSLLQSLSTVGLNPFERMMVSATRAEAHAKVGEIEVALAAYDEAIAQELSAPSAYASLRKADLLCTLSREADGMQVYRGLQARPTLTPAEKSAVENGIRTLLQRPKLLEVDRLLRAGDIDGAAAGLKAILQEDGTPFDRMMMTINLAVVYAGGKRVDEALAAYDQAVAMGERLRSGFPLLKKAYYLHSIGRSRESLELYRKTVAHPGLDLSADERRGIDSNIEALEAAGLR